MLHIELIGCTGAGKSTLAASMRQGGRAQGIEVLFGDEFVLQQGGFNWIKSEFLRTLMVDGLSLLASLHTFSGHKNYYLYASKIILQLPVPLTERLNLLRNTIKKVGIYEIIRRRGQEHQVVVVDEGTLHTVHNLFVHVCVPPHDNQLLAFLRLVPFPDVAVSVRQSEVILIERTLRRGHRRIRDLSHANVQLFIRRALTTFDQLDDQLALDRKLVVVENQQASIEPREAQTDPTLDRARALVNVGVELLTTGE